MISTRALFPGAMGPDGFISCFDHLIPEQNLKRRLILKGGPGVGKSTFMRRLHTSLCPDGDDSTLCFCSGDPDSLDAVVIDGKGLLILDGTAPHTIDPQIPGARDSLINLGACLREDAMRPRLKHIRSCMQDHAAASRRARAFLKAACAIEQDNAAILYSAADASRQARMVRALTQSVLQDLPKPDRQGTVRPVITDAVTPKGVMCLLRECPSTRVIRLLSHNGTDLTQILKEISRAAQSAGCAVYEHLCPMIPGRLMHLTIPEASLLITTNDQLPSEQIFDFAACVPAGNLLRHECALEQGRTASALLMQRAVSAMAQAKQLHDELETFYVPNMDFSAWQKTFDQTLETLRHESVN